MHPSFARVRATEGPTPGPWVVEARTNACYEILQAVERGHMQCVAVTYTPGDARFIAAAPDTLKVLLRVQAELDKLERSVPGGRMSKGESPAGLLQAVRFYYADDDRRTVRKPLPLFSSEQMEAAQTAAYEAGYAAAIKMVAEGE